MSRIILDCKEIDTKEKFHDLVKKVFELKDYYGRNLDALWDMLTEFNSLDILILDIKELKKNLNEYGEKIENLFIELSDYEEYSVEFVSTKNDFIKKINDSNVIVHDSAIILEGAKLQGEIELMENSSVWYNAVVRADNQKIVLGKNSNIQDNAVIHMDSDHEVIIGDYVTIGHGAIVHGATIEDNVIIGMGATVLDGAVIGKNSLVGANALVTSGVIIPEGSLVLGSPAKVLRKLTNAEIEGNKENALEYVKKAKLHNI